MVNFRVATDRTSVTTETLDPSGFTDSGFVLGQIQKLTAMAKEVFDRFRLQSGMPASIASVFPMEMSLYCAPQGTFGNTQATNDAQTDLHPTAFFPDGSAVLSPLKTKGIILSPPQDILRDPRKQKRLEESLRYCFCALITNLFCSPVSFSRNAALTRSLASGEDSYALDPRSVRATTGLSTPDGTGFSPHTTSNQLSYVQGMSAPALKNVPREIVWELFEKMLEEGRNKGRVLSNAEMDEAIRSIAPNIADEILAHPAFAPAQNGVHAIVQLNQAKTRALIWPFSITEKVAAEANVDDPHNVLRYRLHDRRRTPLRSSGRAFSSKGNFIGILPVKLSDVQDFDMSDFMKKIAPSIRHKIGYCVIEVEGLGSFRLERPK